MKSIQTICLLTILATSVRSPAADEPFRTDINPALRYYQAILLEPDMAQADREFLFNKDWRGAELPKRFGELIGQFDTQFKVVRQAGHATVPCDWGIDFSPGPATLLPHLARMKRIGITAKLRALWELQNGREKDARDDLLAALALGRNSSRDGTLIAALVQIAIENIVYSTVAENFYRFSPETLRELETGFESAPPRGLMTACFATEKAGFHDWLVGRILALRKEHPGNDTEVLTRLGELMKGMLAGEEGPKDATMPGQWNQIVTAAGGTSEGLLELLAGEVPLYDRIRDVMALPYKEYEKQVGSLTDEVSQSQDPMVALFMPSFAKARSKEFMIEEQLAMLKAAIEYKLRGVAGLNSVSDPCGNGPFKLERFVLDGVDRGFRLTSAYQGRGYPEVLICVEKPGPVFLVNGPKAGQRPSSP